MQTIEVKVRRVDIVSQRPFDEVVKGISNAVGQPDIGAVRKAIAEARDLSDLEKAIHGAISPVNGLMEFYRFDSGQIISKANPDKKTKLIRFLIGNPLIMRMMADTAPQAASYAPVTILVHEQPDGVHLYYDLMESLLEPYNSVTALGVARDLDDEIIHVLKAAAQNS